MSAPDPSSNAEHADETGPPETSSVLKVGLVLRACALPAILCFAGFFLSSWLEGGWLLIAIFAVGGIVFSGLSAIGLVILLAKVIFDRLENQEDEYYSKNVER